MSCSRENSKHRANMVSSQRRPDEVVDASELIWMERRPFTRYYLLGLIVLADRSHSRSFRRPGVREKDGLVWTVKAARFQQPGHVLSCKSSFKPKRWDPVDTAYRARQDRTSAIP